MAEGEPLSDRAVAEASEILVRHLLDGSKLSELPAYMRPRDRRDGYRIQSRLEAISAAPRFGWKIAATNQGGQSTLGVDGPLAGCLLREFVQDDGGTIALGSNVLRTAEAEFAFRMARDLTPRAQAYTEEEVLEAVADLVLAIEVPDCRFVPVAGAGVAQLIADNSCCGRFVLGQPVAADWRLADLGEVGVVMRINGEVQAEGRGANVLGGPLKALTWLTNELSANGATLRAGETVSTGSAIRPPSVKAGDRLEAEFGELGRVVAQIT